VVNRHRDEVITANIEIGGIKSFKREENVFEINGKSPDIENSLTEPRNVFLRSSSTSALAKHRRYKFSAHSVTMLKLYTA
jgi:alpha-L-arabinofuranosidase